MSASIGIVGAGITGLTCAYRLKEQGFDVHLYEASARPGGPIDTGVHEGFLVEYGPHTILDRTPALRELIESLGLESKRRDASSASKRRYIVRDGQVVALPSSLKEALTTSALSPAAKLRVFSEPFIAPHEGPDDESLASFVSRRLGQEVVDYLVDPFVGGTYAGDPAKLSAAASFPTLHRLESKHGSIFSGLFAKLLEAFEPGEEKREKRKTSLVSFDGGLADLVSALGDELEDQIHLETRVTKVHREANGWKVIYKKGRGNARRMHDAVVFTLPADRFAALELRDAAGQVCDLSPFASVPYAPISLVYLGYRRRDVEHPLDGLGMLVPGVENFHILGTLFISSMFPARAPKDHVSLATFIGGARHPHLCDENDETLFEIARMDLHRLLGVRGEPVFKKLIRYPRAIPQYNVGHGHFVEAAEAIESQNPGLYITGNWKDGIAVPALVEAADILAKTITIRTPLHRGGLR